MRVILCVILFPSMPNVIPFSWTKQCMRRVTKINNLRMLFWSIYSVFFITRFGIWKFWYINSFLYNSLQYSNRCKFPVANFSLNSHVLKKPLPLIYTIYLVDWICKTVLKSHIASIKSWTTECWWIEVLYACKLVEDHTFDPECGSGNGYQNLRHSPCISTSDVGELV